MSTPVPFPQLDTAQQPAWFDLERKQQLAQMLMGSLQQAQNSPSPTTDTRNPYAVQAKRGIMQNLAPLMDALMAGKAQQGAMQAQKDYYNPTPAAPTSAPADSGQTFNGPTGGINVPGAASPSGNVQPAAQPPQNPMIPQGLAPRQAQQLYNMMGPEKYASTFVAPGIMGTPEWQNALRANGGNVAAAMASLKAEADVKGTMHMRQGEDIRLPDGTTIRNPTLAAGETLTRDANGNPVSVSLLPGASDAAGTMTGATTAATQANTPREVPIGGGATRLMYPGQVPGLGAPPGTAQPSPRGAASPAGPMAPTPRAAAPLSAPPGNTPSTALPSKDANGIVTNNLWHGIPTMTIPNTPGQTSNAYTQAIITGAAKKHQELVDKYGEQSAAGTQQLEYLTEAEKALPKAEVGPMSDYLTHNRGLLIQSFPSLAGVLGGDKVTPTLELNKQLTNAALQGARTTFGSRMTQNEVKLQTEEMSPSAGMTRDALVSLINQAKMKAAYGIQQDKDYSDYHAANGDPNRFESQYNVKRPITRFSAQYATPAPALDRLKQNPALLPDFKSHYGWDPTQ